LSEKDEEEVVVEVLSSEGMRLSGGLERRRPVPEVA
jgi:hypothetical protein